MNEKENLNPILPIFSDLMVLLPKEQNTKEWIIHLLPAFTANWFGKKTLDIENHELKEALKEIPELLQSFLSVIDNITKYRKPIQDYCVEFKDIDNRERAVLISAGLLDKETIPPEILKNINLQNGENAGIFLRLREVTKIVLERKRCVTIGAFHGIIGCSKSMLNVFHKIEVYGATDVSVLITGETGTGKELIAHALHERSKRRGNPFVAINCTSLNEELFESELFGHEKGSFTGAVRTHKGRFERADKGTLFLDEIGDMPFRTQAKLLRVLEVGVIERVGGESEKPVDVRIIAATNINLEEAVAAKRFREDLYHRIAIFRIHVAPLRERIEDIPLLVDYFLKILNERYKKNITKLTTDALNLLQEYFWPGNIRELRNVLERVYVEAQTQIIGRNAFNEWIRERDYFTAGHWDLSAIEQRKIAAPIVVPSDLSSINNDKKQQSDETTFLSEIPFSLSKKNSKKDSSVLVKPISKFISPNIQSEKLFNPISDSIDADYKMLHSKTSKKRKHFDLNEIKDALKKTNGNATQAAKLLGVHKATFYRKLQKLKITKEDLKKQIFIEDEQ